MKHLKDKWLRVLSFLMMFCGMFLACYWLWWLFVVFLGVIIFILTLEKESKDPDEGLKVRSEVIRRLKEPVDKSELLTREQIKKKYRRGDR